MTSGRFEGCDGEQARIELRIDERMLSGDIFRLGTGEETWVASFQSQSAPLNLSAPITVLARDRFGVSCAGKLVLVAKGKHFEMALTLFSKLDGLPTGSAICAFLEKKGEALRFATLELLREPDTPDLPSIKRKGHSSPFGIKQAFLEAGIELAFTGEHSPLPRSPKGGWRDNQLHTLMSDYAKSDLKHRRFALHLLWLSKSTSKDVLGVMFDHGKQDINQLPRQGAAVFAGRIRDTSKSSSQSASRLLKTAVHEMGHMLNLVHPFSIHPDGHKSLSFMNYEHRYPGREKNFWKNFAFRFDDSEIAFLHHAPFFEIVPGGAAFRGGHYGKHSTDSYTVISPETAQSDFTVELLPPATGAYFAFAQPVIIGLRFSNRSGQAVSVPSGFLDPKTGAAEIVIERENSNVQPPLTFQPITQRCTLDSRLIKVAAGKTLEDNLNLSFGAQGFPFAEPGSYRITAYLRLNTGETERILRSQTLRIRVLYPAGEEDRAALDIFEPSAGAVLALGGTAACEEAVSRLMEAANRLSFGGRGKTRVHPVATGIYRALAFHYGQSYTRYRDGSFLTSKAQPDEAKRCAGSLLRGAALDCLDCISRKSTKAFLDNLCKNVR